MSAAATAAGYLYASGRLRAKKEEAAERGDRKREPRSHEAPVRHEAPPRREAPEGRDVRVAVLENRPAAPRKTPTVQYKTRRWKPEAE